MFQNLVALSYLFILYQINEFQLDQGTLGLGRGSRDYYLNTSMFTKHLNAYKKYQLNVVKLLLDDANVIYNLSKLTTDVNNIVNFETKFAEVKFC